jgi:hypothetical protein
MTFEQFMQDNNGAPWDLKEWAESMEDIEDCPELTEAAKKYLESFHSLEGLMEKYEIELG